MADVDVPQPEADMSRILTIPNVISFLRLVCVPWFLWLLFAQDERALAGYLLAILGGTDWLDGFIARRWNQVSDLGKVLDPVADRMILIVGVVGIVIDGSVPIWFAAATLIREGLVAIAAVVLASLGAKRIDVTWWGKTGTFFLLIAYPFFLVGESNVGWADTATVIAYLNGIPGIIIAWYAAALYVPAGRKALAAGRAEA